MNGRRNDTELHNMEAGDYGKSPIDGAWLCRSPTGYSSVLAQHEVEEHPDGTITMSPSIFIKRLPEGQRHGYLERGVWRGV